MSEEQPINEHAFPKELLETKKKRVRKIVPGAARYKSNMSLSISRSKKQKQPAHNPDWIEKGVKLVPEPILKESIPINRLAQSIVSPPWSPDSWRSFEMEQKVEYNDQKVYAQSLKQLSTLPPLVTPHEIEVLKSRLRDVALGKAFLLQGGDCAESFSSASQTPIESRIKVLLQMSLVLLWGARLPIVRIARMAGQYAKPRSSNVEVLTDGLIVPSFRGEIINGIEPENRAFDPSRLVSAYFHSATTLNYTRAILASGFADLHEPDRWTLSHVKNAETRKQYQGTVDSVLDCLNFMQAIGSDKSEELTNIEFYTSHEALLLDYESALTRPSKIAHTDDNMLPRYYDTSAHFVWVGERTRQLDKAHIEFVRGLANPIGVKIGPKTSPQDIVDLLNKLDPNFEPGKVTLITRYGAENIVNCLPGHIKVVQLSGHIPVWCCDPMHGNTKKSPLNPAIKTRYLTDILQELEEAIKIHSICDSRLNGVHFELTGDIDVTECIGGSMNVEHSALESGFKSFCDPRLNYEQSMDVAFLIANMLRNS